METPKDNLVRVVDIEPVSLRDETRSDGTEGRTLFGHFAVFNEWTTIRSFWEGEFKERIAPGAFKRTIAERGDKVKVLYDHGKDPQLGNKPLGSIKELREDGKGVYYEVDLLDTPYVNEFILPAARANLLGASFRFSVKEEEWKFNEDGGLDERTITDMDLYEFGPVTFPAYDAATAGVRSGSDDFLDSLARDPRFVARFTERAGLVVTERLIEALEGLKAEQATSQKPEDQERTEETEDSQKRNEEERVAGDSADSSSDETQGEVVSTDGLQFTPTNDRKQQLRRNYISLYGVGRGLNKNDDE